MAYLVDLVDVPDHLQEIVLGYRLPRATRPHRYDIELTTHVHDHESQQQFEFQGKVSIALRVLEQDVQEITLHYRQNDRNRVTLVKLSEVGFRGNIVQVHYDLRFSADPTHELLTVDVPSLRASNNGMYVLEIQYQGELCTDKNGFYRSSYTDANEEQRWIAATQFKPSNARHAFPCYDEPGIRAPIGLKLTHGRNYHAIANMPIRSVVDLVDQLDYKTTEFEDTPSMPCYLLAFVVSDLRFDFGAHDIRAYAKQNLIQNGDLTFALQAGVEVNNAIEDYLDYRLPRPMKLDLVVFPDLATGAIENWGLAVFREDQLIYNPTRSTMCHQKRTAVAIGHEYAHRFFGNLVSPAWWNYLWLSEGFATLMQYIAVGKAYPDLRVEEMITVEIVQNAFQSDALENTRFLNSYAEEPSAIIELFDETTYDKSCSVLRQLQHALGDSVFRTGVKHYLEARQSQAATPDDLAVGLQTAVNRSFRSLPNVLDIIRTWAEQKGYPVLHVSRGPDTVIKLRQERYVRNPSTDAKYTWYLPYNLATSKSRDFSSTLALNWLTEETGDLRSLPSPNWDNTDWVIFNKQQTGYYRVNYDNKLWELIIHELLHGEHTHIHHLNRAQLIDDSLNLARSGHLEYSVALRLLRYMKKEQEYVPWVAFNNGMSYLNRMLADSAKYSLFKQYVWKLVKPSLNRLDLDHNPNDSHFTKLTRNIVINWACLVGPEAYLTLFNAQLDAVVSNPINIIEPNLKSVVYCNGMRNADRETFDFMLNSLERSQDPSDRLLLISALGCTQTSELLQLYLETSLEEISYRDYERSCVLSAVYTNGKIGLELAMVFLEENAETINRLYNGGIFGGRAIRKAVTEMSKRVVNQEQFDRFKAMNRILVEQRYLNIDELAKIEEEAQENVRWKNGNNTSKIESWLDQNVSSIKLSTVIAMGVLMLFVVGGVIYAKVRVMP